MEYELALLKEFQGLKNFLISAPLTVAKNEALEQFALLIKAVAHERHFRKVIELDMKKSMSRMEFISGKLTHYNEDGIVFATEDVSYG